jgi:hypothetical protein
LSDLAPILRQRFFDSVGLPLAGGFLYSYASGTTSPLATYTDSSGLTPMTNPIVLDANGETNFWLGQSAYKFVLTDSLGAVQWTVDPVQSLAAQIASQIAIAGALAVNNNLSDVANKPLALVNLNVAPFSYPILHAVTSGQSATNLTSETFDGTLVTSAIYNYEIIQGTTIMATGDFSVQYLNGTWVFKDGMGLGTAHGITFSLGQTTTIGQLKAAESGLGNGTIKLKRHYFFA